MNAERLALFNDFDAKVKAEAAAESEYNAKAEAARDSEAAAAKLIADAQEAKSAAGTAHDAAVAATDAAYKALRGN